MSDFEKFKEELPRKEKFYSSLTGKKISEKEYKNVFKGRNKFEMKTMKSYHDLYLNGTNFCLDLFSRGQKNCFSQEFIFATLVFPKFLLGLIFANSAFLKFSPIFATDLDIKQQISKENKRTVFFNVINM